MTIDEMPGGPRDMGALFLSKGMLDAAVDAYSEDARRYPESPAPLYFDLLSHVQRQVREIERFKPRCAPSGRRAALLISVPVWGENYIASMGNFLIRTLLAPDNLPAVARDREVFVEFSTRTSDATALSTSRAFQDLEKIVHARIVRYPDHLFRGHRGVPDFNYRLFGAMHHMAILRARALGGIDVAMLCADHVLSDGTFTVIESHLRAGQKMVVSAGMRINRQKWLPVLLNDLNAVPAQKYLSFRPRQLVDYALNYMHPVTERLIASKNTKPFGGLPFPLYFAKPDGVVAHSFVLHPIVVTADLVAREINYDFNTVDGAFLTRILVGHDHEKAVAVLGRDEEAHLFEVSEPDNLQENQAVPFFSTTEIAKYLYRWRAGDIEPVYRWFFQQPIRFCSEFATISERYRDVDENEVVEAILRIIAEWEGRHFENETPTG